MAQIAGTFFAFFMFSSSIRVITRDRFRTSVNIMGDAYGAGIINHWMRGSLERDDQRIAMQRKSVIEKYRLMSVRPSFRRHTGFAGRSSGADV
jgi:hypothetical protein